MRAAVLTIAILAAGPAWGHDGHPEWMMDGYKNLLGESCCSRNRDCLPIPDDAVEPAPGGWRYKPTGEFIPDGNVHRSRDTNHWRCAGTRHWMMDGTSKERTRCLFLGGAS